MFYIPKSYLITDPLFWEFQGFVRAVGVALRGLTFVLIGGKIVEYDWLVECLLLGKHF
jgi:hypothetical protein